MLYMVPLHVGSLRRVAADGQHVFLRFQDRLQVTYLLAGPDANYHPQPSRYARSPAPPLPQDRQVSQLVLMQPEVEIEANGQLANPLAIFTDEYWGFEKMGKPGQWQGLVAAVAAASQQLTARVVPFWQGGKYGLVTPQGQ
nr:hypothetical protein [Tanacetum cinerariifolium]